MGYGIWDGMAFRYLLAIDDSVGAVLLSYKQEVGKESGRYVATYHVRAFWVRRR